MATIEELLSPKYSAQEQITRLMEKSIIVPSWELLQREYYPSKHRIMDRTLNPDLVTSTGRVEYVTRIAMGLQRLAVKRMCGLCFGIPVRREYSVNGVPINGSVSTTTETPTSNTISSQQIMQAMESIFDNNRINSVNLERAQKLFASCEVMTLWYAVQSPNMFYGFQSPIKLRCINLSPMDGDEIFPLFDEYNDLIALSVQYRRKVANETITFFDTYTADRHIKWQNTGSWEMIEDETNALGKIPAIYMYRPNPIWEDNSGSVDELEWSMSRNGNYLRENSRPIFVVTADEEIDFGQEPPVDAAYRSILKYPAGSNAQYVTWQQAVDSLEFHTKALREQFFTDLQLPDWSYENMQRIPTSGEALKQMFIDATLKTLEESGRLLEFLDREVNVVKQFLKKLRPEWSSSLDLIKIKNVITPCTNVSAE